MLNRKRRENRPRSLARNFIGCRKFGVTIPGFGNVRGSKHRLEPVERPLDTRCGKSVRFVRQWRGNVNVA
jgi:hypothetical protein